MTSSRPRFSLVLLTLTCALLLGCRADPELGTEEWFEVGQKIYRQQCAHCHMADGSGQFQMVPSIVGSEILNGDPDRLIRITLAGSSAPELAQREERYPQLMPPFRGLSDVDIATILSFLRRREARDAGTTEPPPVTAEMVAAQRP